MKRHWGTLALAAALVVAVLSIWALGRSAERYSFGRDVRDARSYLSAIEGAEDRCFAWVGAYVPLSRLGPTGCGGLPEGLASGTHDGFNIQVDGAGSIYYVEIWPASERRLVSLSSDQTRKIRTGLRTPPARTSR
jgi:hypothetical protein